jgi:hypothetical protein
MNRGKISRDTCIVCENEYLQRKLNRKDKKMKPNIEYIKMEDLKNGYLYRIRARNARIGIWCKKLEGFLISRFKFFSNFLFVEYHYDAHPLYGTVLPIEKLERVPFNAGAISNGLNWEGPIYTYMLKYLNDIDKKYDIVRDR